MSVDFGEGAKLVSKVAPTTEVTVLFAVERPAVLRLVVILLVKGVFGNQLASHSGNVSDDELVQTMRILALVSVTTKANLGPVVANFSLEGHWGLVEGDRAGDCWHKFRNDRRERILLALVQKERICLGNSVGGILLLLLLGTTLLFKCGLLGLGHKAHLWFEIFGCEFSRVGAECVRIGVHAGEWI